MRVWFMVGTLLMGLFGWWGLPRDRYMVETTADPGMQAPVSAMDDPVPAPTPK